MSWSKNVVRNLNKLLAIAALCSACASSQKNESPEMVATARDYAPLQIGKSWTYQVSYPGQKGEMTVTLVGEKDGYLVDDRDAHFKFTQEGLRDKQRYLIRHPLTAGATWQTVVSASAVEHNKILSVAEACDSVSGSYPDCLVVESSIRRDPKVTLIIRWTWAKNVGLVKLETEAEIAGQGRVPQVKQSLIRFGTAESKGEPKAQDSEEPPDTWTK